MDGQHRAAHLRQGRLQAVVGKRGGQPAVHPGRQHPGGLVAVVLGQALHLAGLGKVVTGHADALQRAFFHKGLGRLGHQRQALLRVGGGHMGGHLLEDALLELQHGRRLPGQALQGLAQQALDMGLGFACLAVQVELAQLRHLATRLVRGWTHLERQKGGIGLRGPGETQLETDRRLLRNRIVQIQSRLERVEKQREQGRQSRIKADVPTVSLVGYTNAGKSTLFNRITEARVYAADQLFATLDPTLRRIDVADVGETVLADTVGFIRHLPHDLVAAFKATLQETRQATLLLHVIDAADVRVQENIEAVNTVLEEIDAHEIPTLLVMNKIDMLEDFEPRIDRDEENKPIRVWLSAQTGAGIPQLFQALTERLSGEVAQHTLRLPPQEGRLRSRFYQLQAIEKEWMEEDGSVSLQVRMPIVDWRRLCKQEPALIDYLI